MSFLVASGSSVAYAYRSSPSVRQSRPHERMLHPYFETSATLVTFVLLGKVRARGAGCEAQARHPRHIAVPRGRGHVADPWRALRLVRGGVVHDGLTLARDRSKLQPLRANLVLSDSASRLIPVQLLQLDDLIKIAPGERVPASTPSSNRGSRAWTSR